MSAAGKTVEWMASDHFVDVNKMIQIASGGEREIEGITLTRYACCLIAQNGDHPLFGKSTQAMKAQWQVPDSGPLADFDPTILLKAKDFATEITIFNARQHQIDNQQVISTEHITNNKAVPNTLLDRGIRPEALPPAEDVKKVERRLASEDKKTINKPDRLDS
jgi:DNA-damage-inducible protein D